MAGQPDDCVITDYFLKICFILVSQVALVVKNLSANAGDIRHRFDPWVEKITWRRAWQHTPVFLLCLRNATGREAWQATVYMVAQSRTQLNGLSTHALLYISALSFPATS